MLLPVALKGVRRCPWCSGRRPAIAWTGFFAGLAVVHGLLGAFPLSVASSPSASSSPSSSSSGPAAAGGVAGEVRHGCGDPRGHRRSRRRNRNGDGGRRGQRPRRLPAAGQAWRERTRRRRPEDQESLPLVFPFGGGRPSRFRPSRGPCWPCGSAGGCRPGPRWGSGSACPWPPAPSPGCGPPGRSGTTCDRRGSRTRAPCWAGAAQRILVGPHVVGPPLAIGVVETLI